MAAGARLSQRLFGADNGFIYMIAGEGRFGCDGTMGGADQTLWLERLEAGESELEVVAETALRFLFLAGTPLDEPVAAHGPFVMNTPQQVVEAMVDYRNGGRIPLLEERDNP